MAVPGIDRRAVTWPIVTDSFGQNLLLGLFQVHEKANPKRKRTSVKYIILFQSSSHLPMDGVNEVRNS
jgi:hypothetical protein